MVNGKKRRKVEHSNEPVLEKINLQVKEKKTEWHRVVIFNEGLVNIVQQYLKKGANVYLEGQLSTRKWRDEKLGQDSIQPR